MLSQNQESRNLRLRAFIMVKPYRWIMDEYESGRITSTGFIIDLLSTVNRDDLKEVLEALPSDLVEQVRDFVESYRPDMRVFRGPPPDPSAVIMAKELLSKAVKST
jgi:hypothetical protein